MSRIPPTQPTPRKAEVQASQLSAGLVAPPAAQPVARSTGPQPIADHGVARIDSLVSAVEDAKSKSVGPAVRGIWLMDTVSFWAGIPLTIVGTVNMFITKGRDNLYFNELGIGMLLAPLSFQMLVYDASEKVRGPKLARAIAKTNAADIAAIADITSKASGLDLARLVHRAETALTLIGARLSPPPPGNICTERFKYGVTEGPAIDALRAVARRRVHCSEADLAQAAKLDS